MAHAKNVIGMADDELTGAVENGNQHGRKGTGIEKDDMIEGSKNGRIVAMGKETGMKENRLVVFKFFFSI